MGASIEIWVWSVSVDFHLNLSALIAVYRMNRPIKLVPLPFDGVTSKSTRLVMTCSFSDYARLLVCRMHRLLGQRNC